ncbi:MAG: hypothetical protein [Microvirus sp.]|nr:MAG: hypothetical protein [Microvirus sp.]
MTRVSYDLFSPGCHELVSRDFVLNQNAVTFALSLEDRRDVSNVVVAPFSEEF